MTGNPETTQKSEFSALPGLGKSASNVLPETLQKHVIALKCSIWEVTMGSQVLGVSLITRSRQKPAEGRGDLSVVVLFVARRYPERNQDVRVENPGGK